MSFYQAKDSELHARQLLAQRAVFTGNLSTGVGNTNFPSNVVVNNTVISATVVTLNVNEPVRNCFRATVRNRVTGANVPIAALPDISVANKISITLNATGLTDVVIEFVYSVNDPANLLAVVIPSPPAGPAFVNLLSAANYAILAKSAITNTTGSLVTGDMGISPAAAASITGFGLVLDGGGQFSTSASVVGQVYAADYAAPTPAQLTQAVSDMEAAYTDAAGRAGPDTLNSGAGNIGGLTFSPGLHKWTTGVTIPTSVTFNGGASDIFILQIAGTLSLSAAQQIILTGGAQAENIYWAVAGAVTLMPNSVFNGILLAQTSIAVQTTATFNGRALAQTAVTLDNVTLTEQP